MEHQQQTKEARKDLEKVTRKATESNHGQVKENKDQEEIMEIHGGNHNTQRTTEQVHQHSLQDHRARVEAKKDLQVHRKQKHVKWQEFQSA